LLFVGVGVVGVKPLQILSDEWFWVTFGSQTR